VVRVLCFLWLAVSYYHALARHGTQSVRCCLCTFLPSLQGMSSCTWLLFTCHAASVHVVNDGNTVLQ
jgi:hypothetical protein